MNHMIKMGRVFAVIWGVLSFLAMLVIGVYCIWTPGSSSPSTDSVQSHLVDTWIMLGLLPSFVFNVVAWMPWEGRKTS